MQCLLQTTVVSVYYIYGSHLVLYSVFLLSWYTYAVRLSFIGLFCNALSTKASKTMTAMLPVASN